MVRCNQNAKSMTTFTNDRDADSLPNTKYHWVIELATLEPVQKLDIEGNFQQFCGFLEHWVTFILLEHRKIKKERNRKRKIACLLRLNENTRS